MRGGSVAVVGGSIAGCAAALAASRGGAERITVFERADAELRDRGGQAAPIPTRGPPPPGRRVGSTAN